MITPKDPRFAAAVRGFRVERTYPANEENYDRVEECGHEFEPDEEGRSACIHCGTLEAP